MTWSPAEDAVVRSRYPHEPTQAIADALGRSLSSVYQRAQRFALKKSAAYFAGNQAGRLDGQRGAGCRFQKGQAPANKGLRRPGWAPGRMAQTQFKAGRPAEDAHNYVPVGSLRICKDGYLERKVTNDPALAPARRWVGVHRIVWEAAHGAIPAGHAVVFLPGKRTPDEALITPDALELVSRAELMRRNSYHTRYPKEVALAIQARGALMRQINKRTKAL